MNFCIKLLPALILTMGAASIAQAAGPNGSGVLAPHKALYDIDLVATRSGSQVINISGKMFYEWRPSCEAWITDHRFNLHYEYADSPGMTITSDFSTYEPFDGTSFDFTSRRSRNGALYQELRGRAELNGDKGGAVTYTSPDGLTFDLSPGMMFPMRHTLGMIEKAKGGGRFFPAHVFDGSDEEGPVEISTFIGKPANALKVVQPGKDLDMGLINTPAWNVRMAVFPDGSDEAQSDYEMSMVFHENGVISDMLIEYDDFSVSQRLVAIEELKGEPCAPPAKKKKRFFE